MAKSEGNKWVLWLFLAAATVYSAFFFARPINLATADLGRHIVNGELIVNGVTDVLYKNYYSFTEPQHEFVNHHWGSGVIFYYIHKLFDFKGLSVLYVLMSLLAIGFMVAASRNENAKGLSLVVALTCVPLFAYRVEVRPEGFSYALIACYYFLLSRFRSGKLNWKPLLIILSVLQLLWVNIHIFFFFGIMVAGAFLLDALLNNRENVKSLAILVGVLILVSLVNPHTYKGLLAPLTIFNEYGYMVAENQTILFMLDRFENPELTHFVVFGILAVGLIGLAFWKKLWKPLFAEILLVAVFVVLAAMAVRGIPLFALFLIPLVSGIAVRLIENLNFKTRQSVSKIFPVAGIVLCLLFTGLKGTYASARKGYEGLGLIEGIDACGKFLHNQRIPGKMFNNYDFGSYLIYFLHDQQKVFVDNRPEAYSVAFFDSIYKPMQENEAVWKHKSLDMGINSIVFYRLDNTPWAQPFLIERTQDPEWVPIYVDGVSLILLRNTKANEPWIKKFALPREMFSGVPNK
ncbi:MAG: hypothetical protein GC178_17010 [Flavobacteriales bacterium]|nr:hypothetical protein [Flavobacteriales bacterium]